MVSQAAEGGDNGDARESRWSQLVFLRPRFTIRLLFLATFVCGVAVWWWLGSSSRIARKFVAHLLADEYAEATALLEGGQRVNLEPMCANIEFLGAPGSWVAVFDLREVRMWLENGGLDRSFDLRRGPECRFRVCEVQFVARRGKVRMELDDPSDLPVQQPPGWASNPAAAGP